MTNHDMTGLVSTVNKLVADVKALKLATPHNNASVSRGAFQILSAEGLIVRGEGGIDLIGRMDAEGTISVTGLLELLAGSTFSLNGTGNVTGTFNLLNGSTLTLDGVGNVTGTFNLLNGSTLNVNGTLNGEGELVWTGGAIFDGDVKITKDLDVTALTRLRGPVTLGNRLEIESGGLIKLGDLFIEAGGSGGQIRFGGSTLQGTSTGLLFDGNGGILRLGHDQIALQDSGGTSLILRDGTVGFGGVDTLTDIEVPGFAWLAQVGDGTIRRVPNDVGSPLGGDLEWPWDPELNTDEFGPRESPGGIGSTNHRGMDFGIGYTEGTDIRVCGRGTVIERGTGSIGGSGFGNFLVVQHPKNQRTLYGHMQSAPTWSVGDVIPKGGIVGKVGNTGSSTGAHLHLETHVIVGGAYEPVNPRTVITKPYAP